MFRKRTFTSHLPQHQVEKLLTDQIRNLSPRGTVSDTNFKIYKTVPSSFFNRKNKQRFCFSGEYRQTGSETDITYSVFPGIITCLVTLIFLYSFIYMAYMCFFSNEELFSLVVSIGLNILNIVTIIRQKNSCIKDFEKQLT